MTDRRQSSQKPNASQAGFGVVILVGGRATRMGIDKSQLILGNQTFLQRIISVAHEITPHVVVVGAAGQPRPRMLDHASNGKQVIWAADQQPNAGPLEGIRVGLRMLADTCSSAFVTSCDVPLLKKELVNKLRRLLHTFDAVVPYEDQRIFGMTAVYQTQVHDQISKMIGDGKLKVSKLPDYLNCLRVPVDLLTDVDPDLDSMTNVNSVDDYLKLLERQGQACPVELYQRLKSD